jgi:site-specific DNA-methyltransferase (cytosine-N4-specific)
MTKISGGQPTLDFEDVGLPDLIHIKEKPYYATKYGVAYLTDCLEMMRQIPDNSVDLVITSPPYALHFQKEYGNVAKSDYVDWFMSYAEQIYRILSDTGSFVINIGGSYNKGVPTRSLYHYKLLIALVERLNFHLAQEAFWYNPAKMPVPAEWVTVRRIRIRDSVEYVWWLSKTEWPKASNRNVLREYSEDMKRLNKKGLSPTERPSGHNIRSSFSEISAGGSIPSNVIEEDIDIASTMLKFGNNSANDTYTKRCKENGVKPHPARYPQSLPEFFIKLLTDPKDIVLDPFAGSNTTGMVAEKLGRFWISADNVEEYVESSKYRFDYFTSENTT